MPKFSFLLLSSMVSVLVASCSARSSNVDLMRQEKQQRDSAKYVQAQQNLRYSDSLLQVLIPQVDPLLKQFAYQKNDNAEDYGHYVHRLLQTSSNTTRNFLQAYVDDNRTVSMQSYYYGSRRHDQRALRLQVGEDYVEKEGSNHAFQTEGWHEILTIQDEDALQLLTFLNTHVSERVCVRSIGNQSVEYVLTSVEKNALADTYQLAVLMRDIDALERAIHVANLQIQKYEKKRANCK